MMANVERTRRAVLQFLGVLPVAALLSRHRQAAAQTPGGSLVKVETKGLTAKIKFENALSGWASTTTPGLGFAR